MGVEFRVNSFEDRWQRNPHVATLADGGFIVAFESYLSDPFGIDFTATVISTQRYDAQGAKVGGETLVKMAGMS